MDNKALINGEFVTLSQDQVIGAANFHLSRIPFAWVRGELVINFSANDDRDHQHWLCEDFGLSIEEFEESPRGYMVDGRIQLFIGSSFREINEVESTCISEEDHTKLLETHFERFPSTTCNVYNGVHVGKVGERWEPIKQIGKFGIMRKIVPMEI